MRNPMRLALLSFAVLVVGCAASEADSDKKAKGKGVEVQIDDFKSTTPADWKEEPPANTMRYCPVSPAESGGGQAGCRAGALQGWRWGGQ